MKTPLPLAAAVFASIIATSAIANQDDMHDGTHGAAGDTQGSAMSETHQRANTANVGKDGKTIDEKMKNEVQDDWREDAKERRDADTSKPEQR
ncbi:hypothetical protein CH92_07590 [Stutzerimonas stutzeri]|uniref:Pentapeptide MXKDX repeat protein n=1 Tax=Stutzerimonas stutzeri TaxID=316 RepID=W8QXG6_STUST|nr:hypothetical protein [Stutzerimonas stutzeri]AHL74969.1 hypothetical protein CH92_07590 [Stutzerimonas stutzeri]MCQ4331295.1 hypothetical protein [Stutzerimonas stutzeri]